MSKKENKTIKLISGTMHTSKIYHSRLGKALTVLCFCPG